MSPNPELSLGPDLREMRDAQRRWAAAPAAIRRDALIEAGARLAKRRSELDDGLRADGLSTVLASYYGDWIVHQGSTSLLSRYTEDLVRTYPTDGGEELTVRRPDGLVFLVTPANSPTINAAVVFSTLLPGNGLVVRAPVNDQGLRFIAEDILAGSLEDHGFSRALVQVRTGRSRPLLDEYLQAPEIDTIVFFGNSSAGRSVAQRGHEHDKKVVLELDGSDHMVVWKDANLAGVLDSAEHAFDFSTQPCPIPKHFLVHHEIYDDFAEGLRRRLDKVSRTIEMDRSEGRLVPVARPERFFAALEELESIAEVSTGGYRMNAAGARDEEGLYIAPTLAELKAEDVVSRPLRCFDEELFFPLIPLVRFEGSDEDVLDSMIDVVARSPFGLRCSVWSEENEVLSRCARDLSGVGLLIFNDDHAQCPRFVSPWGGPRRSGGPYGESHFFWEKTSRLQAVSCRSLSDHHASHVRRGLGLPGSVPPEPRDPKRRHVDGSGGRRPERSIRDQAENTASVRLERSGGRADVILHRPEHHNAIDTSVRKDLAQVAKTLARDESLELVVLRGAGASFCSGGDLSDFPRLERGDAVDFMTEATKVFRALSELPVPVVAAVHGYCLGGGFELALHCDMILADTTARFGFPETSLGLVTTAGSVERLRRTVGEARAKRLLILGERLDGPQAERMGLVTKLCAEGEIEDALTALAVRLSRLPRASVAAMKRLFDDGSRAQDLAAWDREMAAFETLFDAAATTRGDN